MEIWKLSESQAEFVLVGARVVEIAKVRPVILQER